MNLYFKIYASHLVGSYDSTLTIYEKEFTLMFLFSIFVQ